MRSLPRFALGFLLGLGLGVVGAAALPDAAGPASLRQRPPQRREPTEPDAGR